ncbi:hypothetical protein LSAT2_017869 [Lamellibrachia satsuma]|nr:hypothetical protein LSAT2_017869 [Lamellibrachia satsuma]
MLYSQEVELDRLCSQEVKLDMLYSQEVKVDMLYSQEVELDRLYSQEVKLDRLYSQEVKLDRLYSREVELDRLYTREVELDRLYSQEVELDRLYTREVELDRLYSREVELDRLYTREVELDRLYSREVELDRLYTREVELDRLYSREANTARLALTSNTRDSRKRPTNTWLRKLKANMAKAGCRWKELETQNRNSVRWKGVVDGVCSAREWTDLRSHKERCKNSDELSGQHIKLAAAADRFLQALQKQGLDTKEKITKKDLEDVFSKENIPEEDLKVLFGEKISADDIFEKLEDKKGEGFDYGRIAAYLGQRGLDLQAGYMAEFKSMNIGNLKDFLLSLKETMVANTQRLLVKKEDIERTVGINTRYIGTLDFNLEQADRDFLIEQGRRSTVAFLRQYAERHLQDYKLEPPKPFCRDELRRFIDDDLSEIIDPGDYSEKAPDKEFDK